MPPFKCKFVTLQRKHLTELVQDHRIWWTTPSYKKKRLTEKEGLINLIKCLFRGHKYKYNKGAEARETMRC